MLMPDTAAKNITSLLCNDPVRQDNSITPVLAIFIGFVGLAVLLRVLARVLTQAYFWWDDLFNLFAMVRRPNTSGTRRGLKNDTGRLHCFHCSFHSL